MLDNNLAHVTDRPIEVLALVIPISELSRRRLSFRRLRLHLNQMVSAVSFSLLHFFFLQLLYLIYNSIPKKLKKVPVVSSIGEKVSHFTLSFSQRYFSYLFEFMFCVIYFRIEINRKLLFLYQSLHKIRST